MSKEPGKRKKKHTVLQKGVRLTGYREMEPLHSTLLKKIDQG
jgi:hypothetical protein